MSRELWKDFSGTYDAVINQPLMAIEFFETQAPELMEQFEAHMNPVTQQRKEEIAKEAERILISLEKIADVKTVEYTKVLEDIRAMQKQEEEKPPIEEPIGDIKK